MGDPLLLGGLGPMQYPKPSGEGASQRLKLKEQLQKRFEQGPVETDDVIRMLSIVFILNITSTVLIGCLLQLFPLPPFSLPTITS